MRCIAFLCLSMCLLQCQEPPMSATTFTIHGHRGCRGLYPENTIPAFLHATTIGVDALEMDVVITADHQILVSHEPFMIPEIMAYPDGHTTEEMGENIYTMSALESQQYRCGTRPHPRFPTQKLVPTHKPLLSEVVAAVRQKCWETPSDEPLYNIEIKTVYELNSTGERIHGDDVFHPAPVAYVSLFLASIAPLNIRDNMVIQSFDPRILEAMHSQDPEIPLVYLSEDSLKSPQYKLSELSFRPFGLSLHYPMIDTNVVRYCKEQGIALIAWTVNEKADIQRLVEMGVSEIITDYPDRAIEVRQEQKKASR
jgi:glycerophosphoryl diester phosphodiesterase